MQSIVITYLALQLTLLQQLPYISCQQYTFNSNPAVPSRFLVPGGFAAPSNQPAQPQPKRVLVQSAPPQQQFSEEDGSLPHFRKPITRNRPTAGTSTHGFTLSQDSIFADPTPRAPQLQGNSPIPQSESEDQTEQSFASPLSTFEPTPINTVPFRTFKPSTFQTRPTGKPSNIQSPSFGPSSSPQPFFRPNNINLLEEDEEEEEDDRRNPEAAPSPNPSTAGTPVTPRRPVIENAVQQFQRKPTPIHRINTIQNKPIKIDAPQRQPQPSEFTDNKIVRQYEKVPAKTKFEKSEKSEKRSKKPVAQVIRNFREPNADGSITWGFESDDGSYKEETIGQDCITRGKYGYIDPDGVRREYTYSQGLPCDKTKTEQEDEEKQSSGYIDYAHNKVVLPNGESVDMDSMVKNRQRKPAHLRVTRSKVVSSNAESDSTDPSITRQRSRQQ